MSYYCNMGGGLDLVGLKLNPLALYLLSVLWNGSCYWTPATPASYIKVVLLQIPKPKLKPSFFPRVRPSPKPSLFADVSDGFGSSVR